MVNRTTPLEENNGGWWESGFSLLEWEVTKKQGEESRMIHEVMD